MNRPYFPKDVNTETLKAAMDAYGWVVVENVLPDEFTQRLKTSAYTAYEIRRTIQKKNGLEVNMDGTIHHTVDQPVFIELLEQLYCDDFILDYFSGQYILNSYGGVINMPNRPSYVCNIHRDVRTFSGKTNTMMNLLVMLDDFTLENGATYVLSGSHRKEDKPLEDVFFKEADRVTGTAGSLLFFNSNLWHAAGENKSKADRCALTLTFTKPYMKQQMDYPRYLGYHEGDKFHERLQQVLGYHSRTPENLDEWYQPPHKRMYRPGQG
jgi:ectoine hydroxylase-related dioxygenase (phytanoyl-CoA dioxygenase family)